MEYRGFDVSMNVNVDIKIIVDISKIAAIVFAAWVVRHVRKSNREIDVSFNGKELPKNETEAIEFIANEIESQENGGNP